MRRALARLALVAAVAFGIPLAFGGTAFAVTNHAISTTSFCDSGGNCISMRIWLQSTPLNTDQLGSWRVFMRLNCSHSGAVTACRSIAVNQATLNSNDGRAVHFEYQINGLTCTSGCGGAVNHDVTGPWRDHGTGANWRWLATGSWSGCPSTGTQCGNQPYFETGWRP